VIAPYHRSLVIPAVALGRQTGSWGHPSAAGAKSAADGLPISWHEMSRGESTLRVGSPAGRFSSASIMPAKGLNQQSAIAGSAAIPIQVKFARLFEFSYDPSYQGGPHGLAKAGLTG